MDVVFLIVSSEYLYDFSLICVFGFRYTVNPHISHLFIFDTFWGWTYSRETLIHWGSSRHMPHTKLTVTTPVIYNFERTLLIYASALIIVFIILHCGVYLSGVNSVVGTHLLLG